MPSPVTIDRILKGIGIVPSKEQADILFDNHPIVLVKGGWRSGKSMVAALKLITRYWLGSRFALIGVDFELCREEFAFLVEFSRRLKLQADCHFPTRDQCTLSLSRGQGASPALVETKSAKYPERIAAVAYDGIILCEAAQMSSEIFYSCQGRLLQTNGWMLMEGTLESSLDWYADKAKEYESPDNPDDGISYCMPSWSNLAEFPGGRNDPKILAREAILGEERFKERLGGETIKPRDLVLPEFKATLHTGSFPIDIKEPVFLGIDPGWFPSVYAVEFIQYRDNEVFIVDEIYRQGMITEQIIKMVEDKPCYPQIEEAFIDIAAKQHQGQKPVLSLWKEKLEARIDTKRIPVEDGLDRIRSFFIPDPVHGNVRVHIDNKCRGLIAELGGGKMPEHIEGRGSWRLKPNGKPNEENCDALKALIYAVVARYGLVPKRRGSPVSYPKMVTV